VQVPLAMGQPHAVPAHWRTRPASERSVWLRPSLRCAEVRASDFDLFPFVAWAAQV